MSIEQGLIYTNDFTSYQMQPSDALALQRGIKAIWNIKKCEGFDKGNIQGIYTDCYFTEQSKITIGHYWYDAKQNYACQITLSTPQGSRVFQITDGFNYVCTYGKTSNGLALCIGSWAVTPSRNTWNFNFYVGDLVLPDGSVTKGCIYLADDNTHYIATDAGISSESTFTSVIDPTRKSFLVPVTDSTTGGVFKDIYLMANSPVQYNKLKIADTGNKYLCGKSICLAD